MAVFYGGLEIGEKYLRVSAIDKKGDKYIFQSGGLNENPLNIYTTEGQKDIEQTAGLIAKLVKDAGIKHKTVNVVIPDAHSYSQIIEMPQLTEKELLNAIKYQADQFIPVPIDEVSLDIEILKEDKKNRKLTLLIVAATNTLIEKITAIVEMSGLIPHTIENEASAVFRFVGEISHPSRQLAQSASLYINCGFSSTSLYLFNQSNIPVEIRNFSMGVNILTREIQTNYNMSEEDARKLLHTVGFSPVSSPQDLHTILSAPYDLLHSEIERFITASQSILNIPINSFALFGEGAKVREIDKKLSKTLGLPIRVIDVHPYFVKNNALEFFTQDLPLFIPSFGTGMRE